MSISEMKTIYDRLTALEHTVAVQSALIDELMREHRDAPKAQPAPVRLGQPTVRLGG